jgi:hypothetical protein
MKSVVYIDLIVASLAEEERSLKTPMRLVCMSLTISLVEASWEVMMSWVGLLIWEVLVLGHAEQVWRRVA